MEMSIEDAQKMTAASPPSISQLRSAIAEAHADHPQRAMLADIALREIEAAIARLASLGHHFYLTQGEMPQGDEFPKMMYRDENGTTNTALADSAEQQDELESDGWRTKQQAEEAAAEAEPTTAPVRSARSAPRRLPDGSLAS